MKAGSSMKDLEKCLEEVGEAFRGIQGSMSPEAKYSMLQIAAIKQLTHEIAQVREVLHTLFDHQRPENPNFQSKQKRDS